LDLNQFYWLSGRLRIAYSAGGRCSAFGSMGLGGGTPR
jgi:hypothetical protein